MSSYAYLRRATSNCVQFIEDDESEVLTPEFADDLRKMGIVCAYVDYLEARGGELELFNTIANRLRLDNAPYVQGPVWPGVPFLDDLGGKSEDSPGVAIVVDNADSLLSDNRSAMFRLIEAFLIQFHNWLEKGKPCHLCLQMRKDPLVRRFFEQML